MNALPVNNPPQAAPAPMDALLELQLCVARRADELSREQRITGPLNLRCWLTAEYEVIGRDRVAGGMTHPALQP